MSVRIQNWGQAAYGLITTPSVTFSPMARKPRLYVPGGFYHVLAHGNRRATILHHDTDSCAYLERFERYRYRDGVTQHAYE
jgi:hypothetical protein